MDPESALVTWVLFSTAARTLYLSPIILTDFPSNYFAPQEKAWPARGSACDLAGLVPSAQLKCIAALRQGTLPAGPSPVSEEAPCRHAEGTIAHLFLSRAQQPGGPWLLPRALPGSAKAAAAVVAHAGHVGRLSKAGGQDAHALQQLARHLSPLVCLCPADACASYLTSIAFALHLAAGRRWTIHIRRGQHMATVIA